VKENLEQLNIMGKRSGQGFVANRNLLVGGLNRMNSERVNLCGVTVGRRGLANYLRALAGGNIVKIQPATLDDSERQHVKGIKLVCGSSQGFIEANGYTNDKMPMTFCNLSIESQYSVEPNIGASELGEAVKRVLPFVCTNKAKLEAEPITGCLRLLANGKELSIAGTDKFKLGILRLPFSGTGQAVISAVEIKAVVTAIKSAKRAKLSFTDTHLVLDTEAVSYRWQLFEGKFPDIDNFISGFVAKNNCFTHFDTAEALRALRNIQYSSGNIKGMVKMAVMPEGVTFTNDNQTASVTINAEGTGQASKWFDIKQLETALSACGYDCDLGLLAGTECSPAVITFDGFTSCVMPMSRTDADNKPEAKITDAKPEATNTKPEAVTNGKKAKATA
jgi:hypothetical protein